MDVTTIMPWPITVIVVLGLAYIIAAVQGPQADRDSDGNSEKDS